MDAAALIDTVKTERIAADLWRLLGIPSPTGHEREAALAYADMLKEAGAEVVVDESLYDSPCVIGRLRGERPGRVLQLAGHLDHIDVTHAPPRREAGVVHGRGSLDMKGGLACILELVRILSDNGCAFPGELLVTAYGLHEEPEGNTRGVTAPIRSGAIGDAAIVMEGCWHCAAVMDNGLARWDVEIKQNQPACHEQVAGPERDALQKTLLAVIGVIREANSRLGERTSRFPSLRSESVFIGQIHYGDFFNRVPNQCRLQGTRRWQPDRTFEEIQDEWRGWLDAIPCRHGVSIEHALTFIGHAYAIDEHEPIVQSLQRGHKAIMGTTLGVGSWSSVSDVQRLVVEGGVPTIPWGAECDPMHGGHADEECVDLENLRKACRIVLAAACDYLAQNEEGMPGLHGKG